MRSILFSFCDLRWIWIFVLRWNQKSGDHGYLAMQHCQKLINIKKSFPEQGEKTNAVRAIRESKKRRGFKRYGYSISIWLPRRSVVQPLPVHSACSNRVYYSVLKRYWFIANCICTCAFACRNMQSWVQKRSCISDTSFLYDLYCRRRRCRSKSRTSDISAHVQWIL